MELLLKSRAETGLGFTEISGMRRARTMKRSIQLFVLRINFRFIYAAPYSFLRKSVLNRVENFSFVYIAIKSTSLSFMFL